MSGTGYEQLITEGIRGLPESALAGGPAQFRTFARGAGITPERLHAGSAYLIQRLGDRALSTPIVAGLAPASAYVRFLPAGLNLVAVPPDVPTTVTTADLFEATGAVFAVTQDLLSGHPELKMLLPGGPPIPLAGMTAFLLSVPNPIRVDLRRLGNRAR